LKLSARNQLKGRVKSITHGAINSEVVIEIAPAIEIHAQITTAAVHELKLREGGTAYAIIKTDNVMVGVED
jgi:molybdopterin-binding protein